MDAMVHFWDPVTGKRRGRLDVQESAVGTFSPDGATLVYRAGGILLGRKITPSFFRGHMVSTSTSRPFVDFLTEDQREWRLD